MCVLLFNGISTFVVCLAYTWSDKEVHTFLQEY